MSEHATKIGQKEESEEERQFKMILEQSKAQADREAELIKKNEELLKIMAQMEDEKKAAQASQGWGFNKKQVEEKTGDEL